MSGAGLLLALALLAGIVSLLRWRSRARGNSSPPSVRDRERIVWLAAWTGSPLLHGGLALLAAIAVCQIPLEHPFRTSHEPVLVARVAPEESLSLAGERVPDPPFYRRPAAGSEAGEEPSRELEVPDAPASLFQAGWFLWNLPSNPILQPGAPAGRPEERSGPHESAGSAGVSLPRASAGAPVRPGGHGPGIARAGQNSAAGRGRPSLVRLPGTPTVAPLRAMSLAAGRRGPTLSPLSALAGRPESPRAGMRVGVGVQGHTALGVKRGGTWGRAAAPAPFVQRSAVAAWALTPAGSAQEAARRGLPVLAGTELRPLPSVPQGGLSGTSIRVATGSINGTDFRIWR